MSIIVAVMKPGHAIVAGDTQLNDDNGPIKDLGAKVYQIDDNIIVGITGEYQGARLAVGGLQSEIETKKDFTGKASLLSKMMKECCKEGNAIIVEVKNGRTQFATMSDRSGWRIDLIPRVERIQVISLFPSDVTQEFCQQYISSEDNIKEQIIECIKAVAGISESVNDKIMGMETDGTKILQFTFGVDPSELTWKE